MNLWLIPGALRSEAIFGILKALKPFYSSKHSLRGTHGAMLLSMLLSAWPSQRVQGSYDHAGVKQQEELISNHSASSASLSWEYMCQNLTPKFLAPIKKRVDAI